MGRMRPRVCGSPGRIWRDSTSSIESLWAFLVDERGDVAWLRDYGAPGNGGLMYGETADLLGELKKRLV